MPKRASAATALTLPLLTEALKCTSVSQCDSTSDVRDHQHAEHQFDGCRIAHGKIVGSPTALVVALASNVSLSPALQELFTGDIHFGVSQSKVRTSLASNPVIGEKIQARLIATREEVVLRALASIPSLAVAGQHELRANGSVEARVVLFQSPSVALSVREKLIQSLTKDDLSTLEFRLSSARSTYERRWDEEIAAMKKASDYGYDGIFWSEEKRAKLDRDAEFAIKYKWEAWNETVECESFVDGLKRLLAEKEGVNA